MMPIFSWFLRITPIMYVGDKFHAMPMSADWGWVREGLKKEVGGSARVNYPFLFFFPNALKIISWHKVFSSIGVGGSPGAPQTPPLVLGKHYGWCSRQFAWSGSHFARYNQHLEQFAWHFTCPTKCYGIFKGKNTLFSKVLKYCQALSLSLF